MYNLQLILTYIDVTVRLIIGTAGLSTMMSCL